jgi:predicted dinucleotide-binding enzyme
MKKTFGILGAGNIGQSVAHHLLAAGYEVTLANSKGPESLKDVIAGLGKRAKAGTQKEAASKDIVVLAIPWAAVPSLTGLTDWKGKWVVDATNQYTSTNPHTLIDLGGKPSSQIVSEAIPGARIVKAFNTLWYKILASDPRQGGGNRVLWVSGDDAEAKRGIMDILTTLQFAKRTSHQP